MRAQARACNGCKGTPKCASGQAAQGVVRAAKPAVPKQLASAAAGVLANSTLVSAASAAAASPTPFGAISDAAGPSATVALQGSSLPELSLPAVSVDLPDVSGLLDSADPLLVGGVVAAIAIPAGLLALLGGGNSGPKAKAVPASKALEALAADEYCILLDIRSKAEARETGAPNLKGVSRRGPVSVPFTALVKGELVVDEQFGEKVSKLKGVEDGGAPVILLDTDGSEAGAAAKAILEVVPLNNLYYVQGGADAWQAGGGPWKEPTKLSFALPDLSQLDLTQLDFSTATKTIAGSVQTVQNLATEFDNAPASAKGVLAALGVVGASALLFTQVELLLELAGLLAAGQFLLKVVFADEREKTLTEIKKVVAEIDVADLPEDLTKIAATLVEDPTATSSTEKKTVGEKAEKGAADKVPTPTVVEKEPAPAPEPVPVVAAATPAPAPTPAPAAAAAAGPAPVTPTPSAPEA